MPSPSCPSPSVIDQSHQQSARLHGNILLERVAEPGSEEEEEQGEEQEEEQGEEEAEQAVDYAARLYLPVTHGKKKKSSIFTRHFPGSVFIFVALNICLHCFQSS